MSSSKRIQSQGALDGLCGPYAVANALSLCGVSSFADVFRTCVRALPRSRWPESIWKGIDWDDFPRMIAANASTLRRRRVTVTYPFAADEPRNASEYWTRFDEQFARRGARTAILGLHKPLLHWIVAMPDGNRLQFIDSLPGKPKRTKNRVSLHVGKRNKAAKWLIDPGELILFTIEDP